MKSFRQVINMNCRDRVEVVDITSKCRKALKSSGIQEGLALIFPLHTSSAVFITDSDSSVALDYRDLQQKLVPSGIGYRHDLNDYKKNADGHLISIITGHHITCPVTEGEFDFGTYHTIYYYELDGGRQKEILVKIIGE